MPTVINRNTVLSPSGKRIEAGNRFVVVLTKRGALTAVHGGETFTFTKGEVEECKTNRV